MATSYPYPSNISYLCTFKSQTSIDVLGLAEWLAHFPKESSLLIILLFWVFFPQKKNNILKKSISFTKFISKRSPLHKMLSDFPATGGLALHWLAHFIFLFHSQYNDVILEKEKTVLLVKKKISLFLGLRFSSPLEKCFLSCNFRSCFL